MSCSKIELLHFLQQFKMKDHAGKVSAENAKLKANEEYDKFKERTQYQLTPVEIHFLENFEEEQKKLKRK